MITQKDYLQVIPTAKGQYVFSLLKDVVIEVDFDKRTLKVSAEHIDVPDEFGRQQILTNRKKHQRKMLKKLLLT